MADISLDFEELQLVNGSIQQILVDFDGLPDACGDAAWAVDKPFDDSRLQHEVDVFASKWEYRRDQLGLDLFRVHQFIEQILTEFDLADQEAARSVKLEFGDAAGM